MARLGVAVSVALIFLSGLAAGYSIGFNQGFLHGGTVNSLVLRMVEGIPLLSFVLLAIGAYGLWKLRQG